MLSAEDQPKDTVLAAAYWSLAPQTKFIRKKRISSNFGVAVRVTTTASLANRKRSIPFFRVRKVAEWTV